MTTFTTIPEPVANDSREARGLELYRGSGIERIAETLNVRSLRG
jgi:hypothetical protein